MRHLYLALSLVLFALVGLLACDSANPVAPSTSMLFISASPTQIPLRGTSMITVTGFKPDGNPLNRGTQIIFEATFGTIEPRIAEVDNNGRTTAVFTSDGTLPPGGGGDNPQPATAEVTASLAGSGGGGGGGEGGGGNTGGGPTVTVEIQIGETKPLLTLTVTPNILDLNETAQVLAQVRNADGSNFGAGGRVQLRTNLGQLADSDLVTDANGEARTTFNSGNDPGTATVTGFVGSGDEVMVDVMIDVQRPNVLISANPSSIPLGDESFSVISMIARDNNNVPLGAGHRIEVFTTLGSLQENGRSVDSVRTNSSGRAEVDLVATGGESGTATVTAILGSSEPATTTVTIRGDVVAVDLIAPSSVNRADQVISLQARVLDNQNRPVPNVFATFTTTPSIGAFEDEDGNSSSGTEATDNQGIARLNLRVTQQELTNLPNNQFTITVTVQTESEPVTDSQIVQVN